MSGVNQEQSLPTSTRPLAVNPGRDTWAKKPTQQKHQCPDLLAMAWPPTFLCMLTQCNQSADANQITQWLIGVRRAIKRVFCRWAGSARGECVVGQKCAIDDEKWPHYKHSSQRFDWLHKYQSLLARIEKYQSRHGEAEVSKNTAAWCHINRTVSLLTITLWYIVLLQLIAVYTFTGQSRHSLIDSAQ